MQLQGETANSGVLTNLHLSPLLVEVIGLEGSVGLPFVQIYIRPELVYIRLSLIDQCEVINDPTHLLKFHGQMWEVILFVLPLWNISAKINGKCC